MPELLKALGFDLTDEDAEAVHVAVEEGFDLSFLDTRGHRFGPPKDLTTD